MMEENRKRGEEAERKAKEMREAETKRVQEEAKKKVEGQKEEERKRKEQRIAQEGEKAKAAAGAAAAATAGVATSSTDEGSPKAEWERWTAKMLVRTCRFSPIARKLTHITLQHIKNSVLPAVSQNPVYRKACFTAKRAITPKIGQLTSSVSATTTIIAQLDSLLTSLRPPAGQETAIEPYIWTLNHLAKALVKQAEQEVTAKLGTAYPLGRVVVGLLARGHTDLGDVLMARLIKKCFWITGYWPPKRPVRRLSRSFLLSLTRNAGRDRPRSPKVPRPRSSLDCRIPHPVRLPASRPHRPLRRHRPNLAPHPSTRPLSSLRARQHSPTLRPRRRLALARSYPSPSARRPRTDAALAGHVPGNRGRGAVGGVWAADGQVPRGVAERGDSGGESGVLGEGAEQLGEAPALVGGLGAEGTGRGGEGEGRRSLEGKRDCCLRPSDEREKCFLRTDLLGPDAS